MMPYSRKVIRFTGSNGLMTLDVNNSEPINEEEPQLIPEYFDFVKEICNDKDISFVLREEASIQTDIKYDSGELLPKIILENNELHWINPSKKPHTHSEHIMVSREIVNHLWMRLLSLE